MRLIDADDLQTRLYKLMEQGKLSFEVFGEVESILDEQPTAYDVDKVVEKVESRKRILEVAKIPKAAKAAASNAFMMSLEDIKSGGIEQKKKDKKKC